MNKDNNNKVITVLDENIIASQLKIFYRGSLSLRLVVHDQ